MKFTSSQPSQARCNSTIIYFYQSEENLAQFVKVLLVKLSNMLHSSNFVRLFHRQSFALYGILSIHSNHDIMYSQLNNSLSIERVYWWYGITIHACSSSYLNDITWLWICYCNAVKEAIVTAVEAYTIHAARDTFFTIAYKINLYFFQPLVLGVH